MKTKLLVLLALALGLGVASASRIITLEGEPRAANISEERFMVVNLQGEQPKIVPISEVDEESQLYFAPEESQYIEEQLGSGVHLRVLDHGRANRESEVVLEVDSERGLERFHYKASTNAATPLGSAVLSSEVLRRAFYEGALAALYSLVVGVPLLFLVRSSRRNRDSLNESPRD